jgi:ribosome-binding factor A
VTVIYSFKRSERVSEVILRELSAIIRDEVKDPRVGFVTVTSVILEENLRSAKIYISPMGSEDERAASFKGVCSASSFIRNCLGKRMRIKKMPQIYFKLDTAPEHADKINRLLHRLKDENLPYNRASVTEDNNPGKGEE